ncbi:MAG: hypothetical protein ACO3QC_01760 [Phycisphaerales bacterium]
MQGKKAFWATIIVLAIPTVLMTVFAWRMVGGVRADARLTDARLRELAWAVVTYADASGAFPMTEAELRAFSTEGVPDAVRTPSPADAVRRYPATRTEAAAGTEEPTPTLDQCLESIEVEWPTARDVQPILRSKGKATLQGTAPTVGQWLFAMAERLRGG